ncbi:hypothetical protein SAMN04515620_101291 [Collimonas sp. OK607]|nr:hypothetical protein SAMN04515620_101291 [Collimonas sp. OK607]
MSPSLSLGAVCLVFRFCWRLCFRCFGCGVVHRSALVGGCREYWRVDIGALLVVGVLAGVLFAWFAGGGLPAIGRFLRLFQRGRHLFAFLLLGAVFTFLLVFPRGSCRAVAMCIYRLVCYLFRPLAGVSFVVRVEFVRFGRFWVVSGGFGDLRDVELGRDAVGAGNPRRRVFGAVGLSPRVAFCLQWVGLGCGAFRGLLRPGVVGSVFAARGVGFNRWVVCVSLAAPEAGLFGQSADVVRLLGVLGLWQPVLAVIDVLADFVVFASVVFGDAGAQWVCGAVAALVGGLLDGGGGERLCQRLDRLFGYALVLGGLGFFCVRHAFARWFWDVRGLCPGDHRLCGHLCCRLVFFCPGLFLGYQHGLLWRGASFFRRLAFSAFFLGRPEVEDRVLLAGGLDDVGDRGFGFRRAGGAACCCRACLGLVVVMGPFLRVAFLRAFCPPFVAVLLGCFGFAVDQVGCDVVIYFLVCGIDGGGIVDGMGTDFLALLGFFGAAAVFGPDVAGFRYLLCLLLCVIVGVRLVAALCALLLGFGGGVDVGAAAAVLDPLLRRSLGVACVLFCCLLAVFCCLFFVAFFCDCNFFVVGLIVSSSALLLVFVVFGLV